MRIPTDEQMLAAETAIAKRGQRAPETLALAQFVLENDCARDECTGMAKLLCKNLGIDPAQHDFLWLTMRGAIMGAFASGMMYALELPPERTQ